MKVFKMLLFGAVAAGIAWGVWYGYFRDGGMEYVYLQKKYLLSGAAVLMPKRGICVID